MIANVLIFNYQYILGIQNSSVIIATLLVFIPALGSIKLAATGKIAKKSLYVFIICLIFLSGLSFLFNNSYLYLEWNNLIRVILVLIYLVTCGNIFGSEIFINSVKLSIIIQLCIGFWQLYDPIGSNYFLFGDDFSYVSFLQVSGTLGDPNYLGLILLGLLVMYWDDLDLFRVLIVVMIICTQSRTAFILLVGLIMVKMNLSKMIYLSLLMVFLVPYFADDLIEYSRIISSLFEESDVSVDERLNSMFSVRDYLEKVAYSPKGAIFFPSSWKLSAPVYHYPHNTLFYIIAEYSYLSLVLIGVGIFVLVRQRVNFLLLIVLGMILTLPNAHYYFPLYFFLYINEKESFNTRSPV